MEPILYILMRNDLVSMNAGKAVAHGAHAANLFAADAAIYKRLGPDTPVARTFSIWGGEHGFGTTIALHVSLVELHAAVVMAKTLDAISGVVVDPTYPYKLHNEFAKLITHPEPPVAMGDGMMGCVRSETTAGYLFGLKDDLTSVVQQFPLMP